VVLADHGMTVEEDLPAVPAGRRYRPTLGSPHVTLALPHHDPQARRRSASSATAADPRALRPWIVLRNGHATWRPQRDLINSSRFATDFVVETEDDGSATLCFGDGVLGRRPAPGTVLRAEYRVGTGQQGNVGAETLTRVVMDGVETSAFRRVWNPLPASGGTDPESTARARLLAPQAFHRQERAVTEADYAEAAQRHPSVHRAAATRRWTGSWYTMFVTVDRRGGLPVDAEFEGELRDFLERFRMAGYDLEIDAPRFVSLDVALTVCVDPGHVRANVKRALLQELGTRTLPGGRRGFFHPDEVSFGDTVYLSRLIARAMEVPGVAWVDTDPAPEKGHRFHRWGRLPAGELEHGRVELGRLEIARLDNDPGAPEHGRLELIMKGGL
jgi:predicted phage baseplate assembly protein